MPFLRKIASPSITSKHTILTVYLPNFLLKINKAFVGSLSLHFNTRKSSRVNARGTLPRRTTALVLCGGRYPPPLRPVPGAVPPVLSWGFPLSYPEGAGGQGVPPWKGPWTRDRWITPPPCGQTHACENNTFPILRMRAVKQQRNKIFVGFLCKHMNSCDMWLWNMYYFSLASIFFFIILKLLFIMAELLSSCVVHRITL